MESPEGLFGKEEWTGLRIKQRSWELWHFYIEFLSEVIKVVFVRRDMSRCNSSFGMVQLWVIVQISVRPSSGQLCQRCPAQQQAPSLSLCMLKYSRVLLENSLRQLLNFSAHWFFVHLCWKRKPLCLLHELYKCFPCLDMLWVKHTQVTQATVLKVYCTRIHSNHSKPIWFYQNSLIYCTLLINR